eukprot:COSAG01_NODE_6892_length_3448_cov_131.689758_4_plen_106_part_00
MQPQTQSAVPPDVRRRNEPYSLLEVQRDVSLGRVTGATTPAGLHSRRDPGLVWRRAGGRVGRVQADCRGPDPDRLWRMPTVLRENGPPGDCNVDQTCPDLAAVAK